MALISIIIGLMLDHAFRHMQHLREMAWFEGYSQKVGTFIKSENGWLKLAVILALPLLVIALLQALLYDMLWGVPAFLISIPVLFYCLGPDCLINDIEAYLDARSVGDDDEALLYAAVLTGKTASPAPDQQISDVTRAILYSANERVFAVLFWFVLLGPLGAVLYHLAAHLSRQEQMEAVHNAAKTIQSSMAWAPARLLAIGYALTGHFDGAIHAYRARPDEQDIALSNYDVLVNTGLGALLDQQHTGEEISSIRSARSLVTRSILIWIAMLALLTLGGWLG